MPIKTGAVVRLKQPEIRGTVTGRRINPKTDELELLVDWVEGAEHIQRWFDEDLLEPVPTESTEEKPQ